ncbi:MAG: nucleotidyltransferase domain-containing protein [Methanospirillum sp.]|nr:nucleotidyltransferase domain-containing protein [Methanospirillum sp.]
MLADNRATGLSDLQISRIRDVFSSCLKVNKVILFGSRAMGSYRNGSDIDIALAGPELTWYDILHLHTRIDDLNLPFFVDIVHVQSVENPDLLDHIHRVGKILFSRE